MDLSGVKDVWHQADAVCFDVDSTVCTDEGIDELAAFLDVGEQVAKLYVGILFNFNSYSYNF